MELEINYKGQNYTFTFQKPAEKDLNAFIELNRKGKAEKASQVLVFSSIDPKDRTKFKEAPQIVKDKAAIEIGKYLGISEEEPYIEDGKLYIPVFEADLEIEMFEEFTLREFNYENSREILKNAKGIKLIEKMKEIILESVNEKEKMKNILEIYPLLALRIFPVLVSMVDEEVKAQIKKQGNTQQK